MPHTIEGEPRILVVEPDATYHKPLSWGALLVEVLRKESFAVEHLEPDMLPAGLGGILQERGYQAVIMNGVDDPELVRKTRRALPSTPIVCAFSAPRIEEIRELFTAGATDVFPIHLNPDDIRKELAGTVLPAKSVV